MAGMPQINKAIIRLVGVLFLALNDDRAVQRARNMTLKTVTPTG